MGKAPSKARLIIMNLIRLILILSFVGALYTGRNLVLFFSAIGFLLTFTPSIVKYLFGIKIPAIYEMIIILFIYGSLFLGEVRGFFNEFWWWDMLLNFTAALILGFVGFSVLYVIYKDKKYDANPYMISFLTFCFILAIGTLWEIFEFTLDNLFGFNMQRHLWDTMVDLMVNAFGALVVSLLGFSYIVHGRIKVVSEYITNLIEKNPKFFGPRNLLEESSKEILRLIKKGESNTLEFKSTLRTNLHTKEHDSRIEYTVMKTLTAFINSEGGTLLIGVGDTGKIYGLENDKFPSNDALSLHFTNLLKKHIRKEFTEFVNFELFPVEDKHVLKIKCRKSPKPVFLKNKEDEEFHIRNGPTSVKLNPREAVEYIQNHFGKD